MVDTYYILKEDGFKLLQEDGGGLLLESATPVVPVVTVRAGIKPELHPLRRNPRWQMRYRRGPFPNY